MGRHKQDRRPTNPRAAAIDVVRRLQEAGFVALFNGGCVRDMLMRLRPKDYDVATSATPDQVAGLFRQTLKVGVKFGVVLVRVGRFSIEVATFRTDLAYADGRRPVGVAFSNPREDARRRDFTINGMFYDPIADQVQDHVGGRADLESHIIRAIGEPEQRFAEDHLRLLRAARFAARLGFEIEPATWGAMCHHAAEITRISPERIRMELEMILSHPSRASGVEILQRAGILRHLWPGANLLDGDGERIVAVLAALPESARYELGLAGLLHPLSRKQLNKACRALRCSNETQAVVGWLVDRQDVPADPGTVTLADLKRLMAHEAFDELLALFVAKRTANGEDLKPYDEIRTRAARIPAGDVTPPPLLTGDDLMEMGLPAGPLYKRILDRIYVAQLNEEVSDRAVAIAMARRLMETRD